MFCYKSKDQQHQFCTLILFPPLTMFSCILLTEIGSPDQTWKTVVRCKTARRVIGVSQEGTGTIYFLPYPFVRERCLKSDVYSLPSVCLQLDNSSCPFVLCSSLRNREGRQIAWSRKNRLTLIAFPPNSYLIFMASFLDRASFMYSVLFPVTKGI